MQSEPYLNHILLQPSSTPLITLLQQMLSSSQHQKAKKQIDIIASRDPQFTQTIIKIIQQPAVPPEIKLVASSYLSNLIEENTNSNSLDSLFSLMTQILKNSNIELSCRMCFGKCLKSMIEAGKRCATVDQIINLTIQLFESDLSGKILAMVVLQSEATANQPTSDYIFYINAVFIQIVKGINSIVQQAPTELILNWAKAAVFVINTLIVNSASESKEHITSSSDMISYLCSSESISELILNCYNLNIQNQTVDQMRGNVAAFHLKLVTQALKLDETCTSVHFKDLKKCLPAFCSIISSHEKVKKNQEFSLSIIGILSVCASHVAFSSFFIEYYPQLISCILPLFKFDETDIYNFDNQAEEFLVSLDDLCNQRQFQTLKCEAARLLTSLVGNVDGAATYLFRLCCFSLKSRVEKTANQTGIQIQVDECFLIMSIISFMIKQRSDVQFQLHGILSRYSQQLLTECTDIQIGMLYFFLSYSYEYIFKNLDDQGIPYIRSASCMSQNQTIKCLALDFITHQLPNSSSLLKTLTEILRTRELDKYERLYCNYLKSIRKQLTEQDLIYVVTVLMERIKNEMSTGKPSHNMFLAFNIITVITHRYRLLDIAICNHLKQIYPLLNIPKFPCMGKVIEILNSILLAQTHLTIQDYQVLKSFRRIIEEDKSVEQIFVSLSFFVRKTPVKQKWEIIGYILQLIKIACKPTNTPVQAEDVGEGLLLLQLFLKKFSSVLPQQSKKQLLQYLATINTLDSQVLQARLINVYLKIYPSYQSQQFKSALLQSVSSNEKIFKKYQLRALLEGIFQMILIENQKASLQQLIYIAARQLNEYKMSLEGETKIKKKNGSKRVDAMQDSARRMLQHSKEQDLFVEFRDALGGLKQHNQELYNSAFGQFPQYLKIVLKELTSVQQVQEQMRVVCKIKGVKQNVLVIEQKDQDQQGRGKRKRRLPAFSE